MPTYCKSRLLTLIILVAANSAGGCAAASNFITKRWPLRWADSNAAAAVDRSPLAKTQAPTPVPDKKNYAAVQLALGESFEKEGKVDSAESAYEAAIRNDPALARPYHRLALLRDKHGRGQDTEKLFLRAIELDPTNAEIVCDYGYWCYLRRDWPRAEQQFARALQLKPGMHRAYNNMGLVHARTNRPDQALQLFSLAGLSRAGAHTNLGLVYMTEQRLPEAEAALRQAVEADPRSAKASAAFASVERVNRAAAAQNHSQVASSVPTIARPAQPQRSMDVPVTKTIKTVIAHLVQSPKTPRWGASKPNVDVPLLTLPTMSDAEYAIPPPIRSIASAAHPTVDAPVTISQPRRHIPFTTVAPHSENLPIRALAPALIRLPSVAAAGAPPALPASEVHFRTGGGDPSAGARPINTRIRFSSPTPSAPPARGPALPDLDEPSEIRFARFSDRIIK